MHKAATPKLALKTICCADWGMDNQRHNNPLFQTRHCARTLLIFKQRIEGGTFDVFRN